MTRELSNKVQLVTTKQVAVNNVSEKAKLENEIKIKKDIVRQKRILKFKTICVTIVIAHLRWISHNKIIKTLNMKSPKRNLATEGLKLFLT